MGSGGSRGLQNRCFGAEASKGWFDSDAPPPIHPAENNLTGFGELLDHAGRPNHQIPREPVSHPRSIQRKAI